jgi:serine/threonine protein phosphatase 1
MPRSHLAFLSAVALSHEAGDYLCVHAGIRPGVPLGAQEPDDVMGIREPFLRSGADQGKNRGATATRPRRARRRAPIASARK